MGFDKIQPNKLNIKSLDSGISNLSSEIKDMVDYLKKDKTPEEIYPMIEVLKDIYSLPSSYKEKAIALIKKGGKTPEESYSIVLENNDDRFDPKGRRRNRIRKKMGLI